MQSRSVCTVQQLLFTTYHEILLFLNSSNLLKLIALLIFSWRKDAMHDISSKQQI